MSNDVALRARFLADVVDRECEHLAYTTHRLFPSQKAVTEEQVTEWTQDPELAERLDAFVARFSRLQDTVGDKLIPALLRLTGDRIGPAIDNLALAEKFGWINSADEWMLYRQLRNRMIHEYIEDSAVLADALDAGREYSPQLIAMARALVAETRRRA